MKTRAETLGKEWQGLEILMVTTESNRTEHSRRPVSSWPEHTGALVSNKARLTAWTWLRHRSLIIKRQKSTTGLSSFIQNPRRFHPEQSQVQTHTSHTVFSELDSMLQSTEKREEGKGGGGSRKNKLLTLMRSRYIWLWGCCISSCSLHDAKRSTFHL